MPVLTVHNLAGEKCWGPAEVASDHTVAQLREDLAKALNKPAFSLRLLKGEDVLSEGCIESFCTGEADLALQVLGPQNYAEECLSCLDKCPAAVDTKGHGEWLEQAQTALLPSLGFLEGFDDGQLAETEQVRSLCLRLLDQERKDPYGPQKERFPDVASVIAIKILQRIARRGDPDVVRVLKFWLKKIAYKDFVTEENTTSVKTVFHATKAVPDLVEVGDMEVIDILAKRFSDFMNHYGDSNNGPIFMCLEAVAGILTDAHPEGAQRVMHELFGYGYHELFNDPGKGRDCLIMGCRIDKMTSEPGGANIMAILEEARANGVEASADDEVQPATWEQTYGESEEGTQ